MISTKNLTDSKFTTTNNTFRWYTTKYLISIFKAARSQIFSNILVMGLLQRLFIQNVSSACSILQVCYILQVYANITVKSHNAHVCCRCHGSVPIIKHQLKPVTSDEAFKMIKVYKKINCARVHQRVNFMKCNALKMYRFDDRENMELLRLDVCRDSMGVWRKVSGKYRQKLTEDISVTRLNFENSTDQHYNKCVLYFRHTSDDTMLS